MSTLKMEAPGHNWFKVWIIESNRVTFQPTEINDCSSDIRIGLRPSHEGETIKYGNGDCQKALVLLHESTLLLNTHLCEIDTV